MIDYPRAVHAAKRYPLCEPLSTGWLAVDARHTLFYETVGTPEGIPAVFLHGGPGSGVFPRQRQFFDPARYFLTLFDQRGAGRSTPHACIIDNTTQDLVEDIERLRVHLGVERWLVFGGSWGSTLALAYAQAHPTRCLGLILRGVFMGRRSEIDWFIHGMGQFYPEHGARFLAHLPPHEQSDPLSHYLGRLSDPDPAIHAPAAKAWSDFESGCVSLAGRPHEPSGMTAAQALAIARLEAHYMAHDCFLAPDQLLNNAPKIAHLPITIVQGRYDLVCPPTSAFALHAALPASKLVVVTEAGHSANEAGIAQALVEATDAFAAS